MSKPFNASLRERSAFVIAPEPPYPIAGGGAIRTASILEYLRLRYRLEVLTFRESGTPDPRSRFPGDVRVHVVDLPFHAKSLASRTFRNLRRIVRGVPPLVDRFGGFSAQVREAIGDRTFDVGLIEHFWCAPYAGILRSCCRRLVLDLHNVESVLLSRQALAATGLVRKAASRFSQVCASLEQKWIPSFDTVLVTSDADRSLVPGAAVYPNAIPETPLPRQMKRNEIVFSGNLEYEPNQTGARWFATRVWPRLKNVYEDLTWRLVGKNHETLRRLFGSDERITFSGPVEDAVAELARSRVAVVPVLAGSGTRIKIIEAWAAGLPVVSTTIGAEGLPGTAGEHLLIGDTPEAFTAAIERLLNSADLQLRLSAAGRELYEARLSWPAAWKRLEEIGM